MKIGFECVFSSFHSLSLTHKVYVSEWKVFTISQSIQWRRWKREVGLVFLKAKWLSLFIHYDRLLLDFSSMFSRVCITLIWRICHTSQLFVSMCARARMCMCACAGKYTLDKCYSKCRVQWLCSLRPCRPLRSHRGRKMHVYNLIQNHLSHGVRRSPRSPPSHL